MEKAFKLDFINDKTGSLYVNCCGCSQTEALHSFGPASKPHYLIHYVLSGKGHFRFHDKEYRLEAGYGFLIQPNELAFYQADAKDPWSYLWVGFAGSRAEEYLHSMGLSAIKRHPKAFSCAARMIQFHDRDRLDDAGNYYCALGWAYARGKGKDIHTYEKEEKIFASCAGAAIYRKKIFDELGYFDEEHFAYLEDMDVGYRARIYGYENWYAPDAMVYHVGSGTSGSRYNQFKIRYSSRNNIYLIYKNMPVLQIIINLPFLVAGFGIKILFFTLKGFGREYIAGIKNGFQISKKNHKIPFKFQNLSNYFRIQVELWVNIFRRLCG